MSKLDIVTTTLAEAVGLRLVKREVTNELGLEPRYEIEPINDKEELLIDKYANLRVSNMEKVVYIQEISTNAFSPEEYKSKLKIMEEVVRATNKFNNALRADMLESIPTLPLKETEHPYFAEGVTECTYDSWKEYLAECAELDKDYNLLYRYDITKDNDFDYMVLTLSRVQQRKGTVYVEYVKNIKLEDMHEITKYLKENYDYLQLHWTGLA